MIARNVVIKMMPLARGRSLGRNISGKIPYLLGPKKALCVPIRNNTTSNPGNPHRPNERKAAKPSNMTTISASLARTITVRLLWRSARYPAYPENSKKGAENTNMATGCRSWAATFSDSSSMSCLNKLSLNAPRNCVTIMPQKERS